VSEFEKKELFDPNNIAALIDKSKEETAEVVKNDNKVTQSQRKSVISSGLTLNEEDALKAQIFGCWSIPLGLPYNEDLLVRIKLNLKPDGSIINSEILDHARMNKPGQGFYKVLAESALRAIRLCQPLRVPTTGYERWKEIQLNFDAREMLQG
ncbi:TonB C-terminal domain-containing protein, partial [Candidatus Pelagibacter sp.]|nr:TonB C-terminal domain-containing protein [Candidatus Pelagibacter sp.]